MDSGFFCQVKATAKITLWLSLLAASLSISVLPVEANENNLESSQTDPDIMAQVTSVSQLSDVQPTDWAFQALQSLVERYGCIAGYPDGTYRGNRALTRYEFAAGLNACLDRVNELIATASADVVDKQDLDTLQALQAEFAAEIATMRRRVDALETQTAELEANQFSTTTKLTANIFLNVTGAFADGDITAEGTSVFVPARGADGRPVRRTISDDPNVTFSDYLFLNFNTSFTGKDSLVTQLVAGNGNSPANTFASAGLFNTFGVPYTDQKGVTGADNNVVVRELFYSFPVGKSLQFTVGPRVNWFRHFDNNRFTLYLTGASSYNSIGSTLLNSVDRGSGAVVAWEINDQFKLTAGYLGENTEFLSGSAFNTSSNPSQGLFKPTNTITAELAFAPGKNLNLRFLYNRSNIQAVNGRVGGAIGEPIYGFVDDGFGGSIEDATADTWNFNFDWLVTQGIGLFGRYTYASTNVKPTTDGRLDGEVDVQAIQAGLAFPDLGKEGALLTFSYLRPFAVLDGRNFLVSGGGDGGVQYEFEATYYYPITDNIALVPAFYLIANPNNFSDNPNIYVGNLRAQFKF
ncbi:porin [Chroococcidiopsis sp. CCALA 051]|uniref:iron uptake porin n=1 Tax=Chroococcidiopsis sp. CCALA 051 TaxID=869949 RepID=UPI000D0D5235|nr:iron uptake porin [Chroococcidiopsis sp. CCALA 051]MBE9016141.1 carbohydrate porin [Chroococcidiopsidales cyanobacterium LEGE 13417]PSM49777.1 porin [Chroococcidiopsis sp. CCALA 051]